MSNQEIAPEKPKFNRKEYMKNYCRKYNNKKYHEDEEYRRKKRENAKTKSKYVRKTVECTKCGVRNRIGTLYEGCCADCTTLKDLLIMCDKQDVEVKVE